MVYSLFTVWIIVNGKILLQPRRGERKDGKIVTHQPIEQFPIKEELVRNTVIRLATSALLTAFGQRKYLFDLPDEPETRLFKSPEGVPGRRQHFLVRLVSEPPSSPPGSGFVLVGKDELCTGNFQGNDIVLFKEHEMSIEKILGLQTVLPTQW